MKKCRNCGAEIPDNANYCPDCGAAQYGGDLYEEQVEEGETPRDDSAVRHKMPVPFLLGVIGIVASFLVSGVAGVVLGIISINLDKDKAYRRYAIASIICGSVMAVVNVVVAIYYMKWLSENLEPLLSSMQAAANRL